MIKKGFVLVVAALMALGVRGQVVQETTVMVGPLTVPAYTVSFEKDVRVVEEALAQRLKEARLKTKRSEGYLAVIEQVCPEIATVPVSLYTRVEEQGRRKERVAVLTVCAISSDLTIDQAALRNGVRMYVESMAGYVQRYEAGQRMAAEEDALKRAEKAAAAAASTVSGLEKDIASAQKKIGDKKNEIERLKGKIKDLEKDIKGLEDEIERNTGKKSDAEQRAAEAAERVKSQEAEVERWRQQAN